MASAAKKVLAEGDKLDDFPCYTHKLAADTGASIALSDYKGKRPVVLFFYPAASTYGCTKQACAFRDNYSGFKELDCEVLGISSDSVASQDKFSKAHSFPFPLLADTEKVYRTGLGVSGDLFGMLPGRRTIVVSKDGVCLLNYGSATAFEEHAKRALDAVKATAAK